MAFKIDATDNGGFIVPDTVDLIEASECADPWRRDFLEHQREAARERDAIRKEARRWKRPARLRRPASA